jgi:hypothetical protein
LTKQTVQRLSQPASDIQPSISVGANYHKRKPGKPESQVIEKRQRRIVGPVEILKDHQRQLLSAAAHNEVAEAIKQVASSLRRRQTRVAAEAQAGGKFGD